MKDKSDNILIAEFLGWERYSNNSFKCPNTYPVHNDYSNGWTTFTSDQLEFESQWNWIMPVVNKIDQTIKNTKWIRGAWTIQDLPITTSIDEVYKYVIDFIKYYNRH